MVINKTYCKNCVHGKVCGNRDYPEIFTHKISNTQYDKNPSQDYDIMIMSNHYDIDIEIKCKNFISKST